MGVGVVAWLVPLQRPRDSCRMSAGGAPIASNRRSLFLPLLPPPQNVVTHRLLLYPRGVTNSSGPATAAGATQTAQQQRTAITTVWAELMGATGATAAVAGAAGDAGGAAAGPGTPGGGVVGRCVSRLVIASAAMIEV